MSGSMLRGKISELFCSVLCTHCACTVIHHTHTHVNSLTVDCRFSFTFLFGVFSLGLNVLCERMNVVYFAFIAISVSECDVTRPVNAVLLGDDVTSDRCV